MAVGAASGFSVWCRRSIAHVLADWGPRCNLKARPLMLHFRGCSLAPPPKDSKLSEQHHQLDPKCSNLLGSASWRRLRAHPFLFSARVTVHVSCSHKLEECALLPHLTLTGKSAILNEYFSERVCSFLMLLKI